MLAPTGTVIPFLCQICQPSELQNVGDTLSFSHLPQPMKVSHLTESCVQNFLCFHFLLCENKHSSSICSPVDRNSDLSRFVLFKQLIWFTFLHISWGIHVPGFFFFVHLSRAKVLDQTVGECWTLLHNPKIIFWNGHTNLHFYQQSTRDFVNSHLLCPLPIQSANNLALLDFLIFVNHTDLVCLMF